MATGVIETNGIGDSTLYSQVMTGLTNAYNNYGVGNGNYPNVGSILTDRTLYNVWIKNNLDARIFVDGMGITSMNAQDMRASSVRVPLMAPPPYTPRTISVSPYTGNTISGTPGNDGLEDVNLPNVPQTNGVDVFFTQLYDRATVIYELSQEMVSLPIAAQYTAQIPSAVANMQDSTIMATQIANALYRASQTSNSNIVPVNTSTTTEGYLQGIMNSLIGTMTNPQTSWSEGIVQYDLFKSVIIMRQSFFNLLFTVNNGAIVNGGNLPQEMLVRGAFTEDGRPKGNLIRGMYSGVYIKVVPDSYWNQAAIYAGITSGNFAQWNKVLAYICNQDGTAYGAASTTINPIPNPGNGVGTKIQNLWRWGCNVVRPSSIGLVVSSANNLTDFTNPISSAPKIVAPADFGAASTALGLTSDYGTVANIGVSESE